MRKELAFGRCPPAFQFVAVAVRIVEPIRGWFRFVFRGAGEINNFAIFWDAD